MTITFMAKLNQILAATVKMYNDQIYKKMLEKQNSSQDSSFR